MRYDSRSWTGEGYDPVKWNLHSAAPVKRRPYVRWVLLATVLVAPALAGAELVWGNRQPGLFPEGLPPFLALATFSIGMSPFANGRARWQPRDEFESAAIATATRRAYIVLIALLMAGIAWLWLATARHGAVPTLPKDWIAIGFALLVVAINLPVLFAEFAVPLPPVAEPEDDE